MPRYCTLPALFGLREWFEDRFSAECKKHDDRYVARTTTKWRADAELFKGMVSKGNRYIPVAVAAWLFCWSPIGLWYWYTE